MSKFKPRGRALCVFEKLEGRTLLSASAFDVPGLDHPHEVTTVYTESNNPTPGQNAVLALRREADGSLHQIGKFLTGGTGQANPTQGLGPDDSDQEVIASSDGRFLFAVNQGSDSVAVFRIRHDGTLRRVGTFDSGGTQPVSLGYADGKLYVTNRGDALQGQTATIAPNYTGFFVNHNGSLSPIPNSTITLPLGLSPAQTLVSRDGKFVFGDNFAIPTNPTPPLGNTIDPFQIAPDGTLQAAPGGAVGASPVVPLLGLAVHPTQQIIYAGLVGTKQVGVFTYDANGSLTFVRAVPDQGAGVCWITVTPDGKYMYIVNTGTNTVGVYSLTDPLNPVQIQDFKLTLPPAPAGATKAPVAAFELALDPSGRFLDVITQTTAPNHDFPQGNAVHSLTIAADGTLSETNTPVTFSTDDVPGTARIQGVAVVQTSGDNSLQNEFRHRSRG
jgi:6-phosphogluconolactonase (cycloisomerase 2 family)